MYHDINKRMKIIYEFIKNISHCSIHGYNWRFHWIEIVIYFDERLKEGSFFFLFFLMQMLILMVQVFVLMQFDPGLEYQPNRGDHGREGNSWLMLCSALTDGPYSYI